MAFQTHYNFDSIDGRTLEKWSYDEVFELCQALKCEIRAREFELGRFKNTLHTLRAMLAEWDEVERCKH